MECTPEPVQRHRRSRHSRQSGFTLVEIAIAIGVIGFALVAIIGILPAGLEVQRDNRTETIINQDGTFWMEAIRNGARTTNDLDLVSHVDRIEIRDLSNPGAAPGVYNGFTRDEEIIGLLTAQAAWPNAEVKAYVWALSGSAAEKEPNRANREMTFKYRMTVHLERATNFTVPFLALSTNFTPVSLDPLDTLYSLRLTLAYPLGVAANERKPTPRRQSYRALVNRQLVSTNDVKGYNGQLYFFAQ